MTGSDRLPAAAIQLMDSEADELLASTVSIWEVAIKWALRKGGPGDMPLSGAQFAAALDDVGITVLPVLPGHAVATEQLPPIHRDPFGRLLIATAQHEGLRLLTCDAQLRDYGAGVLLV